MRSPPSDRELLSNIYDRYYEDFASFSKENPNRETKIYVPIDVDELASELGLDGDIVFGQLHYHLNKKHGYQKENGSYVHLFAKNAGRDRHCVNFPLVASVLSDLQWENRKFWIAITISIISLIVSTISLLA